ncbi:MAG: alpha-amylase family glycosyl hydrolase, partial [Treponemataceae bacterium]|nr:alpha-amylase family glycosyl hydrolase [Treponemataceae bacterium]
GWAGCKDLVKLNLENEDVRNHLFSAVDFWIDNFHIDGLRLDAADVISKGFLKALSNHCKNKKADFWLMGEVVHGDYNDWINQGELDSVTNYQIYKSLWSAFNDKNLFELSYNLKREFGEGGIYKSFLPYNFLDNHDVNRLGSTIKNSKHLFLLYDLLFLIPGIPSIYYGSEFGIRGARNNQGDFELRPSLPPFSQIPDFAKPFVDSDALCETISRFAKLRQNQIALQKGDYKELSITNETFAFERNFYGEKIIVAINSDDFERKIDIKQSGELENLLTGEKIYCDGKIPVGGNGIFVGKVI